MQNLVRMPSPVVLKKAVDLLVHILSALNLIRAKFKSVWE